MHARNRKTQLGFAVQTRCVWRAGKCCTITAVCVCTLSLQLGIFSVIQKSLLDPFEHAKNHHSQVPMCLSPRDHIFLLDTAAHMLCSAWKKASLILGLHKNISRILSVTQKAMQDLFGYANNQHSHGFVCLCSARTHISVAILRTRQILIVMQIISIRKFSTTYFCLKKTAHMLNISHPFLLATKTTKTFPASFLSCMHRRHIVVLHANIRHSHVFVCSSSARSHTCAWIKQRTDANFSMRKTAITNSVGNKKTTKHFVHAKIARSFAAWQ